MARNEEKAQSLLNRWTSMKQGFAETFRNRRPYLASQCNNLKEAERWRREIVREISKKVSDIQNASLGEHVIRDLNDDINKRMREKWHWEKRIVELGGIDHSRSGQPQAYDAEGSFLQSTGGYKYFGAARNLPGVRELFEKEAPLPPKRSRQDMYNDIEPEYYGVCDDENPLQLQAEKEAEEKRIQEAIQLYEHKQQIKEKEIQAIKNTKVVP